MTVTPPLNREAFFFFKLICCHYAVWHGFGKISTAILSGNNITNTKDEHDFYAYVADSKLVACGGAQKPAVEPAPAADTTTVAVPAKPDLNNPTNRYSYALGMDLGKAIAEV